MGGRGDGDDTVGADRFAFQRDDIALQRHLRHPPGHRPAHLDQIIDADGRLEAEGEIEADIDALIGEMAGDHPGQQCGDMAARGDDPAEARPRGIDGIVMQRIGVAGQKCEGRDTGCIEPHLLGKTIADRQHNIIVPGLRSLPRDHRGTHRKCFGHLDNPW